MVAIAVPKMKGVTDPWRTMLVCSVIAIAMYRYQSRPGTDEGESLSYDSSSYGLPERDGIEAGVSDSAGRWPGFDPHVHSQMPKRRLMEVLFPRFGCPLYVYTRDALLRCPLPVTIWLVS